MESSYQLERCRLRARLKNKLAVAEKNQFENLDAYNDDKLGISVCHESDVKNEDRYLGLSARLAAKSSLIQWLQTNENVIIRACQKQPIFDFVKLSGFQRNDEDASTSQ